MKPPIRWFRTNHSTGFRDVGLESKQNAYNMFSLTWESSPWKIFIKQLEYIKPIQTEIRNNGEEKVVLPVLPDGLPRQKKFEGPHTYILSDQIRQILAKKRPFQLYEFWICESHRQTNNDQIAAWIFWTAELANEEGEKHFRHGTNQMQWAEIEGEVWTFNISIFRCPFAPNLQNKACSK